MNLRPSTALVAGLIAVGAGTHPSVSTCAEPDVLERAALPSSHARSAVLLAVTRTDKRLVAVGERGIALFSDDNGASWKQAQVPVSTSLTDVSFVTAEQGWAVGHSGVVLDTSDGGATWHKRFDGKQVAELTLRSAQRQAADPNDARAGRRLRMAQRLVNEGADKPFLAVHFFDASRGLIAGAYGLLFSTEDGGVTWVARDGQIDNPEGKHLYSISAIDNSVYIAGEQGALYRSTDAGLSFVAIDTPYSGSYFGVLALPRGKVLVYGLRGNAWWSEHGERPWHKADSGTQSALTGGSTLSDGSVLIVSEAGEVLRSVDEGRSFHPLYGRQRFPLSGVVQAENADLVLSGLRGIARISMQQPQR